MPKSSPSQAEKPKASSNEKVSSDFDVRKGSERKYVVSRLPDDVVNRRLTITPRERILVMVLTAVTLFVRTRKLSNPDSVVFDEVHFGGFASKYINGKFFMDVHPPLAKLLYAAIGFLGGFNGSFDFAKIGDVYPKTVPYVLMREFAALCGQATVLVMYLTLKAAGCRPLVCFISSLLLTFENANATIDRFILLDSPMIFFIASAALSVVKLELFRPFSPKWYKSLFATGICLGLATSSKWVGLFTIAWAAGCMLVRLWFLIGDLTVPLRQTWTQGFVRILVIFLTVASIYAGSFYAHFRVLVHEGDAVTFMSSRFRSSFDDTTVPKSTYADVGVSSIVTLKHYAGPEAYLHSHPHNYEAGSKQQQVTLYPYRDANNRWAIELYNVSTEPLKFVPIRDGTKIRLRHLLTSRRLHAHDIRPSLSEVDWQNEASCYGYEGFEGDPNDDFIVEIDKDLSAPGVAQERVRSIDTVFRLHHAMTGCYLFSHKAQLPKWGFEQNEVTCAKQGIKPLELWYVVDNQSPYVDRVNGDRSSYKPLTFLQKLVEVNKVMWNVNEGLTDTHAYQSIPHTWPFLLRGISYWKGKATQLYLLGNPIVWWTASFISLPFIAYVVYKILRWQCTSVFTLDSASFSYLIYVLEFVAGWAAHYVPFFLMGRQLFLHHYLPSLYFGILALGQSLEFLVAGPLKNKQIIAYVLMGILLVGAVLSFIQRDPIVYGTSWTKAKCAASKWLPGWDYDCGIYPDRSAASPETVPQPQETLDFESAVDAQVKDEL